MYVRNKDLKKYILNIKKNKGIVTEESPMEDGFCVTAQFKSEASRLKHIDLVLKRG